MKKFKAWCAKHLPTKRRWIQLYAALLFNAQLKGFATGKIYKGSLKNICTPGLNCYSCPGASGACPLGSLQNSLSESGHTLPFYVFGVIALYGLLFGRWICGFLCPFGLIQELLHKIPTPKLKKNKVTRVLSWFKYVVLAVFVFIIPFMYMFRDFPLPAFCKYICPAGTLEGAMGLLANKVNDSMFGMLGPLFTWKFLLMVSILVTCVFIFRMFCRFICPLGALYGLFNKFALVGVKLEKEKCTDCGLCVSKCQMDIRHVGDHECINCGECISVCPTKAIQWKGSKWVLPENEIPDTTGMSAEEENEIMRQTEERNQKIAKRNRIIKTVVGIAMIATLACTLVYCNFIDVEKEPEKNPSTEDIFEEEEEDKETKDPNETLAPGETEPPKLELPKGVEVGNICMGAKLPYVEGDESFSISKKTDKITVLNFWGTWCGPCKAELPYFDQIASEYADSVQIVTIHSDYGLDKAPQYIEENYPDSKMIFTYDANDAYYNLLVKGSAWPTTVILDQNGVILNKTVGKMEYETLKAIINTVQANETPTDKAGYDALIALIEAAAKG